VSDRFVESFVDKLVLLEQKVGAKSHYRVMPPLTSPLHDCLALQAISKQIAEFIELTGFTFIVAIAKQKEKVVGHIDLSTGGKDVFIEVDSETMKFPDTVAATLCHEVCHKWLQVNGIRSSTEIDNEILTDIASVFLGLGKIMLNGCMTTNVRYETISNGTRTITETLTAGYIDRHQLAFVYRLVCAMRSIPSSDFMQGLNAEAALAVKSCDLAYGHHYKPSFHRIEATQDLVTGFNSRVVEVQRTMSDLNKHAIYIKKSFCETIDDFLNQGHKTLESLQQKTVAMKQVNEADPALRFLHAIKSDFKFNRFRDEMCSVLKKAEGLLRHAVEVGRNHSQNKQQFPAPSPAMFNIVTCPKDGTKLRLPENSGDLIATCPVCKYRFVYNTCAVMFPKQQAPRMLAWWRKLLNFNVRNKSS